MREFGVVVLPSLSPSDLQPSPVAFLPCFLLLVCPADCSCVRLATQEVHLYVVQCLVKELSADVNQATRDGLTPLYVAVDARQVDVVS
jgi:hypothetical protein